MNKIIKIIIITIIGIIILGSIGLNLYYFVWKNIENNLMIKGFNIAIAQIVQSIQKTGEVKISQDLILIKKP